VSETRLSDELEAWLKGEGDKTVGGLIEVFGEKSFALLFVLLLAVPALPLPTGGFTHLFELVAMLIALQLCVGREEIWLPQRWRALALGGERQQRLLDRLLRMLRWLERYSRPRLAFLFRRPFGTVAFGLLVMAGCLGAFLAPPFSGLDTLPALGVVLLSLGVLLEDAAVALVGVVVGTAGVFLEFLLGKAAVHLVGGFF
jgi:hypothetical protein